MHLQMAPTENTFSSCCPTFPASRPHMSFLWCLLYTGPGSTENYFFSQVMRLIHLHHNNNQHSLSLPHIISSLKNQHNTSSWQTAFLLSSSPFRTKSTTLRLNGASHQDKENPYIKNTQITSPMQPRHMLPSPTNKWSDVTHPLRATVLGFNGMII